MSRNKIDDSKKHKARGVSLPPSMAPAAMKRATKLNMSFSKYVQTLIAADLQHGILRGVDLALKPN